MTDLELQKLCLDVRRLQDVNAIQNMISTTSYMFAIGEYSTIYGFFSAREDITAEVAGSGKKTGREAVKELLVDMWQNYADTSAARLARLYPEDPPGENRNGLLDLRALCSPVIEVAADRKTAKGLWLLPGTQTFCPGDQEAPRGYWVWTKLAVDFLLEDGRWRLWHLWSVPCMAAPAGGSWTDFETGGDLTMSNPYSIHGTYPHPPAPPKPYATFSETFSY